MNRDVEKKSILDKDGIAISLITKSANNIPYLHFMELQEIMLNGLDCKLKWQSNIDGSTLLSQVSMEKMKEEVITMVQLNISPFLFLNYLSI